MVLHINSIKAIFISKEILYLKIIYCSNVSKMADQKAPGSHFTWKHQNKWKLVKLTLQDREKQSKVQCYQANIQSKGKIMAFSFALLPSLFWHSTVLTWGSNRTSSKILSSNKGEQNRPYFKCFKQFGGCLEDLSLFHQTQISDRIRSSTVCKSFRGLYICKFLGARVTGVEINRLPIALRRN